MKKYFLKIFPFVAIAILTAKVLNWFLNFSDATNDILNAVMFIFIGISYFILSFSMVRNLNRILLAVCGLFLIVLNFLPESTYLTVVGILAILLPMLIVKFSKEAKNILNAK